MSQSRGDQMADQTKPVSAGADRWRSFQVQGLACQNEVRLLNQALLPLMADDAYLSIDPRRGLIEISVEANLTDAAIIAAISATGMTAIPDTGKRPQANETVGCQTCSGEATPSNPSLAPGSPATVFAVHGMDCSDEVATLKRELGPLVGRDALSFDLINGRMTVAGNMTVVDRDRLIEAVAHTGMRAEPWSSGAPSDGALEELRRRRAQTRLTIASGLFTLLGLAVHARIAGMAAIFHGSLLSKHSVPVLAMVAYAAAILAAGRYVAPKAVFALRRLRPDMNLLMMIAVVGSIGIGQWFEAATVAFFFALALALEAWSLGRARQAVAALMKIAPPMARLLDGAGGEKDVPVAEVPVGARIVLSPGSRIPLDGLVVSGTSEIDQAPITGESVPVSVATGTAVFAGTINGSGALIIETTRPASDTTLARIVRMVSEAQSKRAPSDQWVERFARIYTPVVMVGALLVLLVPPLLIGGAWSAWFYQALVLLVIACPCALVISTPVSIVAGLTGAARRGVLIKGGLHLEAPARITIIALDKTGTLTKGRPAVAECVALGNWTEAEIMAAAASVEARSEHPIARAILDKARELGLAFAPAASVRALPGHGVTGKIDDVEVWIGSLDYWLQRSGSGQVTDLVVHLDRNAARGLTTIVVGRADTAIGLIAVGDTVRPEARGIVEQLHALGVAQIVMLTGDSRAAAEAIARETGIDDVRPQLLPEQKVEAVAALSAQSGMVAMVGDGINDAPAMARAGLGIAMGAMGSDVAIETADIALMQDDLSRLPWLIRHSRATLAIIRQNIGFSLCVKLVFVVLTITGSASLWGAIAADVGASLLVVLNGLRLLNLGGQA